MEEELKEETTVDTSLENVETSKTYTEEEVEAIKAQIKQENEENFDKKFNKKWGREKQRLEEENSKALELAELLKEQTKITNMDDLLDMSYKQYKKERPVKENTRDLEVLGKADAKEIMELEQSEIEAEANRLAGKKRNARENATFLELGKYLKDKENETKLSQEIKENGISEELVNSQEFKDFRSKFNSDTSIKDIVDIYNKANGVKQKPYSAGSLKGDGTKEDSEFYSEDEYNALTEKDLQNPKVYEKAMRTMHHLVNS